MTMESTPTLVRRRMGVLHEQLASLAVTVGQRVPVLGTFQADVLGMMTYIDQLAGVVIHQCEQIANEARRLQVQANRIRVAYVRADENARQQSFPFD